MRLHRRIFRTANLFWLGCATLAPGLAWWAAKSGFGMAHGSGLLRDLAVLALAAVAEEIVFRGGIQEFLLRRMPLRWTANVLTSLLFAAVHLWAHSPSVALGVLPVSLVLGWAYERSGRRILPPMLLHLYFNLLLYGMS
jgi:membrane protease YdiL (CAAX protease family)